MNPGRHITTSCKSVTVLALVLISACSSEVIRVGPEAGQDVPASASWAVLPISNFSSTPQAGDMVQRLLEPSLRSKGIGRLVLYDEVNTADADMLGLNRGKRYQDALKWAAGEGVGYAVSGSVQEWRYKSGVERRPVAALSLKLIDVGTGQVIWSCTGADSGGGADTISGTAQTLLDNMLSKLEMTSALKE